MSSHSAWQQHVGGGDYEIPAPAFLWVEPVRDASDNTPAAEEQRRANKQSRLVVQQVLPPTRWDEFRHDDGKHIILIQAVDFIDVLQ